VATLKASILVLVVEAAASQAARVTNRKKGTAAAIKQNHKQHPPSSHQQEERSLGRKRLHDEGYCRVGILGVDSRKVARLLNCCEIRLKFIRSVTGVT
jgi:hypothetical protein